MGKNILMLTIVFLSFLSCSTQRIRLEDHSLELINREIVPANNSEKTLVVHRKRGDGIAILKNIEFDNGTIELELKGENNPQKSFVGVAFNIQNDSVYEAVYFRPFNFQSEDKIRREHSIQYIYKPEYEWRFLRTNYEGQYEAEFPRKPSPDDWFKIRIVINAKEVTVFDAETNTKLLTVKRLITQVSNRIGLWTGFDSKGEFKNLKINRFSS